MERSIDQEKVIEGLMLCTAWEGLHQCHPKFYGYDCPYDDEADCKVALMKDALTLLKKQEELQKRHSALVEAADGMYAELKNRVEVVRCKACKHHGKSTCSAGAGIAYPPPDDWFCADGERR